MKKKAKKKTTKKAAAPKKKKVAKKAAPKKAAPKKVAAKKVAPKKVAPKKVAATFAREFPPVLSELHELSFDYDDGNGIDFEPYEQFMAPEENTSWLRAWTGNQELVGHEYRVFGQDGTGGYAAFWITKDGDLLDQPIVFFGSEGELGVVAKNFADYLWVLADGTGPLEAISYGGEESKPHDAFTSFATKHAPKAKKSAKHAIAAAKKEFPHFEKHIQSLIKH